MDSSEARRQPAALIETEAPHRETGFRPSGPWQRDRLQPRDPSGGALPPEAEGAIWRHVGRGDVPWPAPRRRALAGDPARRRHRTCRSHGSSPAHRAPGRRAAATEAAGGSRVSAAARRGWAPGPRPRGLRGGRQRLSSRGCRTAGNPVLLGVLAYLADARRRAPWQHEWDRTYRRIGVAEFRGRHSDQHAANRRGDRGGDGVWRSGRCARIWRRSGPRWPRPGDGRGGEELDEGASGTSVF